MSKRTRMIGSLAVGLIALVIVVALVILSQNDTVRVSVTPVARATAPPAEAAQNASSMTLRELMIRLADDDPAHGPEDAPVIMVEFSDYLCPWCGKFYFDTLPRLLEAYPTQLRYVPRDYPVLGMNAPDAPERAALAAGCALAQGYFWEMHTALMEPYKDMDMSQHMRGGGGQGGMPDPAEREAMSRPYTAEALRETAEAIGLDMVAYETCVAAQTPAAEIAHDLQDGMQLEISSVPTYIINGVLVQGAQSYEAFAQVIDAALADSEAG